MRILIDENIDFRFVKELRRTLTDHVIDTAQDVRLVGDSPAMAGLNDVQKDTRICELAAEIGFDVLIVTDRGFERQQDLQNLPINVFFLDPRPRESTVEHLKPLLPMLNQQIHEVSTAINNGRKPMFVAIRSVEPMSGQGRAAQADPLPPG